MRLDSPKGLSPREERFSHSQLSLMPELLHLIEVCKISCIHVGKLTTIAIVQDLFKRSDFCNFIVEFLCHTYTDLSSL